MGPRRDYRFSCRPVDSFGYENIHSPDLTRLRGFARLNGDFRLVGIRQVIDIYHKYYVATAEIGCSEDLPYSLPLIRPARFVRSCFYGRPNERRVCPGEGPRAYAHVMSTLERLRILRLPDAA